MSAYNEIYSYVTDTSRHAVCGAMQSKFGDGSSLSRPKVCFDSDEAALSHAAKYTDGYKHAAYLCQFCAFWHLGSTQRVGVEPREFVLVKKEQTLLRNELAQDTPLHNFMMAVRWNTAELSKQEYEDLEMHKRSLPTIGEAKFVYCRLLTPQLKAVAWALHVPQRGQIVLLRNNDRLVFRQRAGEYWTVD